jgi:hypothetical protein
MPSISRNRSGLIAGALAALVALTGMAVQAMEITTAAGADGRRIVVARGVIGAGDTERLRRALALADPGKEGLRTIAIDSPGGAVDESFDMATLMDRERVTVIVRSGAICASACAQIVFLAGIQRVVQDGGRLGLHSCARAGSGTRAPICNETIARLGAARGAPYGTLMAFMSMTGPDQIRWLDAEEADCWGLTLWPEGSNRGIRRGDVPPCMLRGPGPKIVARHEAALRR